MLKHRSPTLPWSRGLRHVSHLWTLIDQAKKYSPTLLWRWYQHMKRARDEEESLTSDSKPFRSEASLLDIATGVLVIQSRGMRNAKSLSSSGPGRSVTTPPVPGTMYTDSQSESETNERT